MFHVMIVDDEESILHILKSLIQWSEYNVAEVYTARDGQIALDIMKNSRIDLLITDIQMPTLNGLELIEQAKALYPDMRFILLSAYGEFEYARKAISLGVENYLLKPIVKNELESTVKKTLENVYNHQFRPSEQLKNNILSRWVTGSISQEELADRAVVLEINTYLPQYLVVCTAVHTLQSFSRLLDAYERALREYGEIYSFWDEKSRYVMILGGRKLQARTIADSLQQLSLREKADKTIRISVGCVVNNASLLNYSFQIACDNLIVRNITSCVVWEEKSSVIGIHNEYLIEELRWLLFCKEKNIQRKEFCRISLELCNNERGGASEKKLQKLINMCVRILITEFPVCERPQDSQCIFDYSPPLDLNESNLPDELIQVLLKLQWTFDLFFSRYSPIIQKATKYIWDRVLTGKSCSIKEFCEKNSISAAYLGTIYKSETGFFFNEYLSQCRINRSVILLHSPGILIGEIAEMVGFTSSSYFIQRFKECKGVSPQKYRERIDF